MRQLNCVLHLDYSSAVKLVEKLNHLAPGVPKYQQKRFNSIKNQIRIAFGPEFCDLYK